MRTLEYALVTLAVAVGVIYAAHKMSQAMAASFNQSASCISDASTCRR